MITSRRGLLTGLISFGVAAPAIVRAASLMPVKVYVESASGLSLPVLQGGGWAYYADDYADGLKEYWLRVDGRDQFGRVKHEWVKVEAGFLTGPLVRVAGPPADDLPKTLGEWRARWLRPGDQKLLGHGD